MHWKRYKCDWRQYILKAITQVGISKKTILFSSSIIYRENVYKCYICICLLGYYVTSLSIYKEIDESPFSLYYKVNKHMLVRYQDTWLQSVLWILVLSAWVYDQKSISCYQSKSQGLYTNHVRTSIPKYLSPRSIR